MTAQRVTVGLAIAAMVACASACSSPAPTASLVSSADRVSPGSSVTLSGAFSSHKAGLSVRLESAATDGTYQLVGVAAATDGSGAYALTFTPKQAGQVSLRVEVLNGKKSTASPVVKVTALGTSSVQATLSGPTEIGLGTTVNITGRIQPAIARSFVLQMSPDGSSWTATGAAGKSTTTGTFSIALLAQAHGELKLRVLVSETEAAAQAASAPISVYIADYKADGAKYLACVRGGNVAVDALNTATDAYNSGSIDLHALEAKQAAYAAAMRLEINCLHAYVWPPSVATLVSDIQAQSAVAVDNAARLAKAVDITAYSTINNEAESIAANSAASADAAKIRRALGLPARS